MKFETLTVNANKYQSTQQIGLITVSAGQTVSSIIGASGLQLRDLLFPANWTACNISFYTSPGANPDQSYTLFLKTNFDGSSLLIPTVPSQDLPILPALFDATKYFQISCDAPQATDSLIVAFYQPIYQGIHA